LPDLKLAERVMLMSIYESLMIIISAIRLIIDAVRVHNENKNNRPDPSED